MLDLRYLTVNDLEKLKVNLEKDNLKFKDPNRPKSISMFEESQVKENEDLIAQIEHEIFERQVLGAKTDGGVSN